MGWRRNLEGRLIRNRTFWGLFTRSVKLHTAAFRATGGRVGGKAYGVPVLLLNHVGRKSGKRYTSPLLYIPDGDDLLIVASKGGFEKHPSWWINLRANPETAVELRGEKRAVCAHEANPSERGRLWAKVVDAYPPYATYQKRTQRQIPVVILSPR